MEGYYNQIQYGDTLRFNLCFGLHEHLKQSLPTSYAQG